MKKRIVISVLILVLSAGIMTSCGSSANKPEQNSAKTESVSSGSVKETETNGESKTADSSTVDSSSVDSSAAESSAVDSTSENSMAAESSFVDSIAENSMTAESSAEEAASPVVFTEPVSLDDAVLTPLSDWDYYDGGTYYALNAYQGNDTVIMIPTEMDGKPVNFDFADSIHLKAGTHVRGIVYAEGWKEFKDMDITADDEETLAYVEAIRLPASLLTGISGGGSGYMNPFFNLTGLKTFEVGEGSERLSVTDEVLYYTIGDQTTLICYPAAKEGEEFEHPEGIVLSSMAFSNNPYLKTVTNFQGGYEGVFRGSSVETVVYSESITDVFTKCFEGGETIRSITLPAGVTSCGGFPDLPALEEIVLSEGNEKYLTDDGVLYYRDGEKLTMVTYPSARQGEEYTVPEGTAYFYKNSFQNPLYLKRLILSSSDADTENVPSTIEIVN